MEQLSSAICCSQEKLPDWKGLLQDQRNEGQFVLVGETDEDAEQ